MTVKRVARDKEARFIEMLICYRDEYRNRRVAEVNEERARRHARDEVYIAGGWVLRTESGRIARGLQRHEVLTFVEIVFLLVLLVAVAAGLWSLFAFLFLP